MIHLVPDARFQTKKRLWQGCPTIERTRKGRLFAGWYSGGMCEPDMRNYNLLVRSDDDGLTWSEPILVIESRFWDGIRCIDIQLWTDPAGVLHVFWTQVTGWGGNGKEHHETWEVTAVDPDAETVVWTDPVFVTEGFLRCKPTVLRNGTILLCAYHRGEDRYVYSKSTDGGKNWLMCFAGKKVPTCFDESMILEHTDGTLRLFARTDASGTLAESVSTDGGVSWTDGQPGSLVAPSSRFYLARLKSGNLLRINSDDPKNRTNLKAFLSFDDGKTWPCSLLLDDREHVSYPDAVEDDNGHIYIVHDWSRFEEKAIFLSRVTERDIQTGGINEEDCFVARLLNQPPRHPLNPY